MGLHQYYKIKTQADMLWKDHVKTYGPLLTCQAIVCRFYSRDRFKTGLHLFFTDKTDIPNPAEGQVVQQITVDAPQ